MTFAQLIEQARPKPPKPKPTTAVQTEAATADNAAPQTPGIVVDDHSESAVDPPSDTHMTLSC